MTFSGSCRLLSCTQPPSMSFGYVRWSPSGPGSRSSRQLLRQPIGLGRRGRPGVGGAANPASAAEPPKPRALLALPDRRARLDDPAALVAAAPSGGGGNVDLLQRVPPGALRCRRGRRPEGGRAPGGSSCLGEAHHFLLQLLQSVHPLDDRSQGRSDRLLLPELVFQDADVELRGLPGVLGHPLRLHAVAADVALLQVHLAALPVRLQPAALHRLAAALRTLDGVKLADPQVVCQQIAILARPRARRAFLCLRVSAASLFLRPLHRFERGALAALRAGGRGGSLGVAGPSGSAAGREAAGAPPRGRGSAPPCGSSSGTWACSTRAAAGLARGPCPASRGTSGRPRRPRRSSCRRCACMPAARGRRRTPCTPRR